MVVWGLDLIEHPRTPWAPGQENRRLFGWLEDYDEELIEYRLMTHMGQETCRMIKQGGITSEQAEKCRAMLKKFGIGARLRRHATGIQAYLKEVESKVRPGEILLGSSDLIESIFGKYEFLVERSLQKAITRSTWRLGR